MFSSQKDRNTTPSPSMHIPRSSGSLDDESLFTLTNAPLTYVPAEIKGYSRPASIDKNVAARRALNESEDALSMSYVPSRTLDSMSMLSQSLAVSRGSHMPVSQKTSAQSLPESTGGIFDFEEDDTFIPQTAPMSPKSVQVTTSYEPSKSTHFPAAPREIPGNISPARRYPGTHFKPEPQSSIPYKRPEPPVSQPVIPFRDDDQDLGVFDLEA